MKKMSFFLLLFLAIEAIGQRPYITVWKTNNSGVSATNQIRVPAEGSYTYVWEEVGNPGNNGNGSGADELTITFPSIGTYRLSMTPTGTIPFHRIAFPVSPLVDNRKLLSIEQWGDVVWSSMQRAYYRCSSLGGLGPVDVPDLSNVTNMAAMFQEAGSFNYPIGNWNVSNVVIMDALFFSATSFNQPIGNWDVSNVTSMASMFWNTPRFNQPIGNWNVSKVTSMEGMFAYATDFNQAIEGWDVGNVTTMRLMFIDARNFNRPIANWDVSKVTVMDWMFSGARSFNQDIGIWDLSVLANATRMLDNSGINCENYSHILHGWANNPLTPSGVPLGAVGRTYGVAAAVDRDMLTNTLNWTINGDGQGSCVVTLPVVFNDVKARYRNGQLIVNWRSLTETSNSHFDIEVSADGTNFTKIGTIKSKAINGNSSQELHYEFITAYSGLAALGLTAFMFLGVLGKRKSRLMLSLIGMVLVVVISCSKSVSEAIDNKQKIFYIRIAQTDKDGTRTFSKVIKVVSE
ncbi:BspA family leucine-rich repeat surface protein [Niabella sp. CJ426]|uniref:BspA family leucine-rich repeat surface protein n=1 Tax=Niabella sp. CJ426 TaxID=3393740 RepID=UPI003CFBF7CC